MSEITVKAGKFQRLLDYMGRIGLDVDAIAGTISVSPRSLARLGADVPLPAQHYSYLYKEAVQRMQALGFDTLILGNRRVTCSYHLYLYPSGLQKLGKRG